MHVLIAVLHRPTKPTGVCRHAANLARCLVETEEVTQVSFVTGTWQKEYFETVFRLSSPKIKVIGVDIPNRSISRNLWFLNGLPVLANRLQPHIVHLSFPLPFVRSRFDCPVVATIHDLYPYECPENFGRVQSIFNRLFLRQCIAQSNGLTCVSQETLKKLKFFFPKIQAELAVIYNSVDFTDIVPQPPEAWVGEQNLPFLLTVAQHRKNKNLHILIQAFAHLLQQHQLAPETLLVLVGSPGPETENLQQQIATLQLQTQVLLLSSVSDGVLCWLYQNCRLYTVASSTEGFCLPLAEALHLGCKVVCSDIPILREVAGEDCVYFRLDSNSVENLERAISETINPSAPVQAVTRNRFSLSAIATQYLQLYTQICQQLPS
ncbi:glycosyltransferase family 1 protein [Acaryochloris sp. IP29b_bin.148]|uniref:glycosyltransferase family 4 protein n=1 Tax=Acaryochloris sp. IP29b_bin.148 TaxID=2969218 RepID=UPI002614B392|nr:glycosyltransferase family 1 protein [Acaryochloris sp. IP29b_bin.148]